jgi:predicted alpha/beta hydrolase
MSEVVVQDTTIAARDCTDAGVAKIGHFGFFRPEHRDTLWRDAASFFASGSA